MCVQYIDYKALKKQLSLIKTLREAVPPSAVQENHLRDLKLLFQRHLDSEISKMLSFYNTTCTELKERMEALQSERRPIVLDVLNVRLPASTVLVITVACH